VDLVDLYVVDLYVVDLYVVGLVSSNEILEVEFEVLTAVSTKMAFFWVVAPCSLVEVYQRFRGPCCLHHQSDRFFFVSFKL
jgi:hypothetical protein